MDTPFGISSDAIDYLKTGGKARFKEFLVPGFKFQVEKPGGMDAILSDSYLDRGEGT
jgi:hypothetical protein